MVTTKPGSATWLQVLIKTPENLPSCQPRPTGLNKSLRELFAEAAGLRDDALRLKASGREEDARRKRLLARTLIRSQWKGILQAVGIELYGALRTANGLLLPPLFTMLVLELYLSAFPSTVSGEVELTNQIFCVTFLGEWLLGLLLVRRWDYLRNAWLWVDFISALPFNYILQFFRVGRFGRLLRVMKFGRFFKARRMRLPLRDVLRAVGVAGSASLAGAFALAAIEPETVDSFGHAGWWRWSRSAPSGTATSSRSLPRAVWWPAS